MSKLGPPDLRRTTEALKAFDKAEEAFHRTLEAEGPESSKAGWSALRELEMAEGEVGRCFAEETADRNHELVARLVKPGPWLRQMTIDWRQLKVRQWMLERPWVKFVKTETPWSGEWLVRLYTDPAEHPSGLGWVNHLRKGGKGVGAGAILVEAFERAIESYEEEDKKQNDSR